MMTLANYGIGSSKPKDPNSAKVLSKSLQIRNRAELALKQCLKSHYRLTNEKRIEILNSMSDYYSRIPFNMVIWNKYQTKQCIIDSILLLDSKFNPYKARESFRLVEKMLINLVHLPWHSEFRKIHTYSGLYRLSISDPLIGVEEVFKAAGFQEQDDCLMHLVLPDEKMPQTDDGESVTSVIFDCMMAQVVLSNIIDIFENCCKASKQCEENITDINCYSWIQAYFRERSHQTTERACSNIQELLSNITNHLAKLDITTFIKSSSGPIEARNNNHQSSNNDKNGLGPILKPNGDDPRESPRLTAQERTREFLAQQSHEDENLLTLSNDLLRIPYTNGGGAVVKKTSSIGKYNDHDRPSTRPPYAESIQQQSLPNNGYNNKNQYHQKALYDRMPGSKQVETSYESDDHHHSDPANTYRDVRDSLSSHPVEIDTPHNDREPLIARFDRRLISHNPNQSQPKRTNVYNIDSFDNIHLIKSNSVGMGHLGDSGRHHFDNHYFSESSSHPQSSSSNHQIKGSASSSSKYNSSPYKKYESRDIDNSTKLTNSRSYWSCGSCTYNNLVNSEICEMCRNRKPSH